MIYHPRRPPSLQVVAVAIIQMCSAMALLMFTFALCYAAFYSMVHP